MPTPKNMARLALILPGLLLCLWVSVYLSESVYLQDSDFFTFWLAGKTNYLGLNPHDPLDWAAGHRLFDAPNLSNPIFLYPLPLAILLAPLGLLSLQHAFIAWIFLTLLMVVASLVVLLRMWGKTTELKYLVPILAAAALFRPVISTLYFGQLSGLLLLILSVAALAFERRAWFWAGFLLGALALKPNIGVPFLILAGLWLVFQKRWQAVLGMAAGGICLLLIGLGRNLGWIANFLSMSGSKFQETFGYSPTLWGISGGLCGFSDTCTVVVGGSLAALLVTGASLLLVQSRKPLPPAAALSLITCASLLVTPYLWPYDQSLLVLPILAFIAHLLERNTPYLLTATVFLWIDLLAMVLMVITIQIELEVWNGFLPVTCLILVGVMIRASFRAEFPAGETA